MHVHNLTFVTNIYKKKNTNVAKILLYKFSAQNVLITYSWIKNPRDQGIFLPKFVQYKFFAAFMLIFFLYLFIENAAWGASFHLFFRHGVDASLCSILFH